MMKPQEILFKGQEMPSQLGMSWHQEMWLGPKHVQVQYITVLYITVLYITVQHITKPDLPQILKNIMFIKPFIELLKVDRSVDLGPGL